MRSRAAILGAILALFVGGCGGVQYSVVAGGASSRLEEAKSLGADTLAPYEYYAAKEHLEQAEIEAAAASYSDAVTLAHEAEEHAAAAIELTKKARHVSP